MSIKIIKVILFIFIFLFNNKYILFSQEEQEILFEEEQKDNTESVPDNDVFLLYQFNVGMEISSITRTSINLANSFLFKYMDLKIGVIAGYNWNESTNFGIYTSCEYPHLFGIFATMGQFLGIKYEYKYSKPGNKPGLESEGYYHVNVNMPYYVLGLQKTIYKPDYETSKVDRNGHIVLQGGLLYKGRAKEFTYNNNYPPLDADYLINKLKNENGKSYFFLSVRFCY